MSKKVLQKLQKAIKEKKHLYISKSDSSSDEDNSDKIISEQSTQKQNDIVSKKLFQTKDIRDNISTPHQLELDDSSPSSTKNENNKRTTVSLDHLEDSDSTDYDDPIPGPSTEVRKRRKKRTSQVTTSLNIPVHGQNKSKNLQDQVSDTSERTPTEVETINDDVNNFAEDIFTKSVPIFENDDLQIYVVKQNFKRQKIFKFDDHQFVLKVKVKNNANPYLLRIENILFEAFKKMLENLKKLYSPNDRNLIYMTIFQRPMVSALNSGAFELQTNSVQEMLDNVFNMFNRFINSNLEVKLDDTFSVYFKVLSMPHVNYPKHRRRFRANVGNRKNAAIKQGTVEICTEYSNDPNFFLNKCLLISIALGYLRNEGEMSNAKQEIFINLFSIFKTKPLFCKESVFRKKNIYKKEYSKIEKENATLFLKNYLDNLCKTYNFSKVGPYDIYEVCETLSKDLKTQIHILENFQGNKASIISFPSEFDDSLPQIFLDKSSQTHVSLIVNLLSYFRQHNRKACFVCKSTFSLYYRHRCLKRSICFQCRRFYKSCTSNAFIDSCLLFCDAQNEVAILDQPIACLTCNNMFTTKNCFDAHKSLCGKKDTNLGRNGYYCNVCHKNFKTGFKNAQDAKENHFCNSSIERCKNCKNFKENNHLCKIKKQKKTTKFPKLAFFSFGYKNLSECYDCKLLNEKNENAFCSIHSNITDNNSAVPNIAIIYKETKRGQFQKIIIFDDDLDSSCTWHEDQNIFSYEYFSENEKANDKFETNNSYLKNVVGLIDALNTIKQKKKEFVRQVYFMHY